MNDSNNSKLIFGTWALRGKSHVIRLVMQYLRIPYEEKIYTTPQSWYEDPLVKSNEEINLPYLIDQDFIICDPTAILIYLLKKSGYQNFLGISIQDQAFVDMYLISMKNVQKNLIGASTKQNCSVQELLKVKQDLWNRLLKPKLQSVENFLRYNTWFLGYLSVVDFDIYEMINYIRILFPSKLPDFKNMESIANKISLLTQMRDYSRSQSCGKLCYLPVQMCKRFKVQ